MVTKQEKLGKKIEKANAVAKELAKLAQKIGATAAVDGKYDFVLQHADEYYETLIESPV